jgi:ATP-dependent RNA helicase DDX52/ROK1
MLSPLGGSTRGIKRKRGDASETQPSGESIGPNYFDDRADVHNGEDQHAVAHKSAELATADLFASHSSVFSMSEENRRRILKSHKIKVTLLERNIRNEPGHKKHGAVPSGKNHDFLWPQPLSSFSELHPNYGVSSRLVNNLEEQGYTVPTEVQLVCIPLQMGYDYLSQIASSKELSTDERTDIDLLTIAPTGSGKTLAYLLPTLHGLLQDRHINREKDTIKSYASRVGAIIVAPTHELVDQIVNEGKKLAAGTGLRISGMRKGMSLHTDESLDHRIGDSTDEDLAPQGRAVKSDVLVTTPLVLLNALSANTASTPKAVSSVRYLILDEADVLLDPLFRDQTLAIWNSCNNQQLRTTLWSATIGSSIEDLAQSIIVERRRRLGLGPSNHHLIRVVLGLKDSALPTIDHRLIYAATEQGKLLAVRELLHPSTTDVSSQSSALRPPFLIFTQTIARAIALHSELLYDIPPEAGGSSRIAILHSDLSDTTRSKIMTGFRKGEIWILITTDLLSRGIDFRGINGVVNYDIPNTAASYIHRAGRTGRAGREGGVAVTLYTKEDIPYVKNIANVIAASQKLKAKGGGHDEHDIHKWLLDSLPKVSKKTRKELKVRGVAARRTPRDDEDGALASRKTRISTKSGYDRRQQSKRKAAIEGSKQRKRVEKDVSPVSDSEGWGGIEG